MKNMPLLFLLVVLISATCFAQTSGFTYQGKLGDDGAPANGSYDFQFKLFDQLAEGVQKGSTLTSPSVVVENGVFTAQLDFGANFPGDGRYLEVSVRLHSADPNSPAYSTLSPRQQIRSTPYAIRSLSTATADNVSGVVPVANGGTGSATQNFVDTTTSQFIDGNKTFLGVVTVFGPSGAFSGNGSSLTHLDGQNITDGTVLTAKLADGSVTTAKLADGSVTTNKLAPSAIQNSGSRLSLLGSLRWDLLMPKFGMADQGNAVAFDGANIWTANASSVTKLQVSDGQILANIPISGGSHGIAFDGTNIWVSNYFNHGVTKLRASDNANLGTFNVGLFPAAIAFDGANVWVANQNSNNVTKLRASDGANLGTFPVGNSPQAIAFDGTSIWTANWGSSNVSRLRASDGAILGTYSIGGTLPLGIAFDGANIWVANYGTNNVTRLRPSDGMCVSPCTFAVGHNPVAIAFDGANVWVVNQSANDVTKLRAVDGANFGAFPVGGSPAGIAFDGANMWVTNSEENTITKLPVFP